MFFKNSPPTPYKVLIQLTNECNSRCKSCHIWKININAPEIKKSELRPDEYNDFFKSHGRHLYWIALSGGEISLFENLDELLNLIAKHCSKLCIFTFTTNGLLPEKILEISKNIKLILPKCDLFVTVSLDGNEKLHDSLRGIKGNYQLAHKALNLLKAEQINAQFGLTLNNDNSDYLLNLSDDDQLPAKAISIVHSDGIYHRQFSISNISLSKALLKLKTMYKIQSLGEIVEYLFIKLGITFLQDDREKMSIPCEVINTSIHLTPYGDVLPCMYMPSLGNIKKENINDILISKKTKTELERIKNEQCPNCWMNCYAPHSMMRHPIKTLRAALWK